MMQLTPSERSRLEGRLNVANIMYWLSLLCMVADVGFFFYVRSYIILFVAAMMGAAAFSHNQSSKEILRELGREDEI